MSMKRLLCMALLLTGAVAQSQEALRHALIIGVSTYADPRVPVLAGVAFDMDSARRIALAMGIPVANITVLRDAQATKEQIVAQMKSLGERAGEGSRVLIYFSGHGTRWQDAEAGGCVEGLLTHDSQAIVNREFARLAQPLGAKADKVVIMFDACHSGGVSTLRSLPGPAAAAGLRPKFFVKADAAPTSCSRPVNMRTRSLLGGGAGVDELPENVVQITSSRPDEVSFDDAAKGGLATQGVRDCLLGKAKDLDGSGSITLAEIEACAQEFVREQVKPWPELLPHHVSVRGLRNLIPVPVAAASAVPAAQGGAATNTVALTVTADSARLERERLQREQAARAERERLDAQREAAQRDEQWRLEQQRLTREQSQADAQRLAEQFRLEQAAALQAAREQQARDALAREREEQERQVLAAAANAREREAREAREREALEREARTREAREQEARAREAAALARIERDRVQRELAARNERERQEAQRLAAQARAEQQRLAQEQRQRDEQQRLAREEQQRSERQRAAAELQEREARQAQEQRARAEEAHRLQAESALATATARPQAPTPVAAVAAMRDLYEQRDRRHTVHAQPASEILKIGQDLFELSVTSARGGYLYVVLLGSDETSFYVLFPNALDKDNRVQARVPLRIPRPHWQVQAPGPAGTDHLLVMVTEQPRDLTALSLAPAQASAPFTYTAANAGGRSRLINFMLGEGASAGSTRFGAAWLTIKETP